MSAHRKETTRAIVLARHSAGEGSVRLLFYTESLGLLSTLAKSGREERSKLRPHLQTGTMGTFSFVQGRDIWRVTGATATTNVFFELGERSEAREAAARLLLGVRQFVRGTGADDYLFKTLFDFFVSLKEISNETILAAESVAMLRVLSALGYVREDGEAAAFIPVEYDRATLERAQKERLLLVRTVNEAIAASGL